MVRRKISLETEVEEIGKYGAAVLHVSAGDFFGAGFAPGDLVEVTISERKYTMPVGTSYSDVDSSALILMKITLDPRMLIARNNSSGFAWKEHIVPGEKVRIELKKKRGYLREYELRSVQMSGSREDYASDEEFANFRMVQTGDIRPGRLYRGFSPINPEDSRNICADRLLSRTRAVTAINLDNESLEDRRRHEGYESTFYSRLTIIPVPMSFSSSEAGFEEGIRKLFLAVSENEAPYFIHCRYSRDRTGLACALIEAVCGADVSEIVDDYMLSYENIHHLERGSKKWIFQAEQHVIKILRELSGLPDPLSAGQEELREALCGMLRTRCGISEETLKKVYDSLCC